MSEVISPVRALREHFRKQSSKRRTRAELLLLAFLRGWPHARIEPRVSEHNLPSWRAVQRVYEQAFQRELTTADMELLYRMAAWCKVPEERIKRFGPRRPKERPSRLAAGVGAAALALALAVAQPSDAPAQPAPSACIRALEGDDAQRVAQACQVDEILPELAQALP
jgi:hypothetical protein